MKKSDKVNCVSCLTNKATLECGLCTCSVCKYCAQILDEDQFSFLKEIPKDLSHSVYCPNCFDNQISKELNEYNDLVKAAHNIQIFMSNQGKETRLLSRKEDPITVEVGVDEKDVLLRLAFQAAKMNFNSVIDVEVLSKKVKNGKHQTHTYWGQGIPCNLREDKLLKDRSLWHFPN